MKHLYNDDFTPRRATKDSAGYDIFIDRDIEISNKEYTKIDTNVVFEGTEFRRTGPYEFPRRYDNFIDWVAIIAPRSSYGMKYGLHFSNTIGIIDKDYRDNIILHARVTTDEPLKVRCGDRIAQMIIVPYYKFLSEIEPNMFRSGGLGSTGN